MAEPNEATPLLDLKTLLERPTIAIDGEHYEILSPDELTVVDSHRFAAWGNRIDKLMAKKTLTKAQEKELGQILGDLGDRIMVGVPEALRVKLSDAQRMEVAEVFTKLPLQKRSSPTSQTKPSVQLCAAQQAPDCGQFAVLQSWSSNQAPPLLAHSTSGPTPTQVPLMQHAPIGSGHAVPSSRTLTLKDAPGGISAKFSLKMAQLAPSYQTEVLAGL